MKDLTIVDHQIDLISMFKKMLKHIKLYILVLFITSSFGLIVAFSIPKIYSSKVVLAPEMGNGSSQSGGGLASLASMAGINLNNIGDIDGALYLQIYPSIISSTTFVQELENINLTTSDNIKCNLKEYLKLEKKPWWDFSKLFALLKSSNSDKLETTHKNVYTISKKDWKIIENIQERITCDIDKENGLITLSVEAQDPQICAQVADKAQTLLQQYITDYRTKKARNDLMYFKKLQNNAKNEYFKAQKEYVNFSDANFDINLPSLQEKRDYLENQMQLKYNTYTQLTDRVNSAEAKVQERTPDFVVLQPSLVPYKADSPKKILIVLVYFILGFIGTSLFIFKNNIVKAILNK